MPFLYQKFSLVNTALLHAYHCLTLVVIYMVARLVCEVEQKHFLVKIGY